MKNLKEDDYSDDGVVQRLSFSTPEKQKSGEWKIGSIADDYTRKILESNKKSG